MVTGGLIFDMSYEYLKGFNTLMRHSEKYYTYIMALKMKDENLWKFLYLQNSHKNLLNLKITDKNYKLNSLKNVKKFKI